MINRIAALRKAAKLTQEELSHRAGVARPFLSDIENCKANPTVEKAAAIAKALGCTIDELYEK